MSASTSKLDPDSQLLLDQPLLRLPHEQLRKNFKSAQRIFERENTAISSTLRDATRLSAEDSLKTLDSLITRMQGYKRKVSSLHDEEKVLHGHTRKRIAHLQNLYEIPSLVGPAYDRWSRTRLDRLLVDYLLRAGFGESANCLAEEKGIGDLVDCGVFVAARGIEESLKRGSTAECLNWCQEHKQSLKKNKSTLEFELRLQQFVELIRNGQTKEAMAHSKKYLAPHKDTHFEDIQHASALLAFLPTTNFKRYRKFYSPDRWADLASSFVRTHYSLYGLPSLPLIQVALSCGLSALKTPSCHSHVASSSSNTGSTTTSLCPICSTELNALARNVPYAHHNRSSVEPDPMVMPNGRIYGMGRLMELASKLNLPAGIIRDPTTGQEVEANKLRKVYIM